MEEKIWEGGGRVRIDVSLPFSFFGLNEKQRFYEAKLCEPNDNFGYFSKYVNIDVL